MKVNILEAHDRYQEFTNKSFDIGECCQDLINQRPFGNHPFYIFAHARTDEDGYTKRLIWQPRLTRPKTQTNSMLFKAYPGSDNIRICWMLPARELWNQYKKGNVTEHDTTSWSIEQFENNRAVLEAKEDDDLNDDQIDAIYRELSVDAKRKSALDKLYSKPTSLEVYSSDLISC
jgi:hypothetical protein